MMAFPQMLVSAAKEAGMSVPDDCDNYNANEFPHFHVFCNFQLGRRMDPGEHGESAKVIARIPENKIREVTIEDIVNLGGTITLG